MIYEQKQHTMNLEKTYQNETEEWSCPDCGYRILISWEPRFKKQVLQEGEPHIIHAGGKGGLIMGGVQLVPQEVSNELPAQPPVLLDATIPTEPASPALKKLLKDSDLDHLL